MKKLNTAILTLSLLFGTQSFAAEGSTDYYTNLDSHEVFQLVDGGMLVIDVRDKSEYNKEHIYLAENMPLDNGFTKEAILDFTDTDLDIVLYGTDVKAVKAAHLAASWGFEKINVYKGGLNDWKAQVFQVGSR